VKYAQCVKIWPLLVCEVCAVSEVLCSVSDGHYTESGNSSVSDEEKGRHTRATRVSYLRRRETRPHNSRLVSEEKGDTPTQRTSPFYLTCTKKTVNRIFTTGCSLRQPAIVPVGTHTRAQRKKHYVAYKLSDIFKAIRLSWV
jgi:hypothetical protein